MLAYVPLELFLEIVRARAGRGPARYWESSGLALDARGCEAARVAGVEACRLEGVRAVRGGRTVVAAQRSERAFVFDDGRPPVVFRDVRFCWVLDREAGRIDLFGRQGRVRMGAGVELVRRERGGGVSFVVSGSFASPGYAFAERIAHRAGGAAAGEGEASFFRRTWRDAGSDEALFLVARATDDPEALSPAARRLARELRLGAP